MYLFFLAATSQQLFLACIYLLIAIFPSFKIKSQNSYQLMANGKVSTTPKVANQTGMPGIKLFHSKKRVKDRKINLSHFTDSCL